MEKTHILAGRRVCSIRRTRSSHRTCSPYVWVIIASYLEFIDKITIRSVCTTTRKHNYITSIPLDMRRQTHIWYMSTDDILLPCNRASYARKLAFRVQYV